MNKPENETMNLRSATVPRPDSSQTDWDKLTIKSRFIFAKVMQQKELCLPLLQRLFPELDITDIQYVEAEKTVEGSIGSKGVRFDVYVKDPRRYAFTLEMQVGDYDDLPRRSRYYSAMICEDLLAAGRTYSDLPPAYVVMLCPFDLFRLGLHRYTFTHRCSEALSLDLEDGAVVVFLNSRGTEDDVSPEILSFLKYMEGTVTKEDPYIVRLDEAVQKAKKNADWRRQYMNYEMELAHEKKKARNEVLIKMIAVMVKKGMSLSSIADLMEIEEAEICPLYDQVCSMPGASPEDILMALQTPPSE